MLAPTTEQDRWFCKSLMLPSSVYQSFSVLALVLIAVFGCLIILVSLYEEDLATKLRKSCGWSLAPKLSWDDDSMLRLQERVGDQCLSRKPPPPPKDRHMVDSLCRPMKHRTSRNARSGLKRRTFRDRGQLLKRFGYRQPPPISLRVSIGVQG